ncbi:MAG: hypothetical protein ACYTXA_10870, partial [Nostoc sp.]
KNIAALGLSVIQPESPGLTCQLQGQMSLFGMFRSGLKLSVFRPELLTILIASKTIWRNCLQAGAIAVFSGVRSPLCLVSQSDALL